MPQIRGPTKIERGKSYEIIKKLKEQNFTGLLRVSFKTDEISKSELIVENGTPVAMETKKIRTGRILRGNEAFQDFINAENCVAEFYLVEIKTSLLGFGAGSRLDSEKVLGLAEKVETKPIEELETATLEVSELDRKKLEIARLLDSELGKIAKKYVKLVESVNSLEELFEARDQIFGFLDTTTTFLPKEKVARVKSEINRALEALKEEKLEEVKESEFEEFKKDLISNFDKVLGSRELREILDELEDWSDLIQKYPQIKKVAGKFATVVPWNKVEELLRMIEERVAEETGTKLR
ncbi:MAG: DUF2226 domain-containing protein [Archaeoglobaceae archaeon]